MDTTLAQHLATFVCGLSEDTLPDTIVAKAKTCLLNGYGIAFAGLSTPYHVVAAKAASTMYTEGGNATIWATGTRSTVTGALMANAALCHGRAQEDTCGAAHLGAVMIPLLTALIETGRGSTEDLISALVAGYEAGGLFEELLADQTTPTGFRATTLFGVTAAATAASRLLKFSPAQTVAAMANAVSFSGGVLQSFAEGTDEWRYQVGITAQAGWAAAELAQAGSVSAVEPFEGAKGLAKAFANTDLDVDAITAGLGQNWQTARVAFKPFPVCAFNQTPVTAALDIRERMKGRQVKSVDVRMNPYECGYAGMDSAGPFNSISGTLMSIPFCIALTLVRGAPSMQSMVCYDDTEVNMLVDRIKLIPDPEIAVLSCHIFITYADETKDQIHCKMTPQDYAYGFADHTARLKETVAQEDLPTRGIDQIAKFSADPAAVPLQTVLKTIANLAK